MANIQNLRPFQKGQSGNLKGRPAIPEAIRQERRQNLENLIRVMSTYLNSSEEEIAKKPLSEKTRLELAIEGLISKAKEGDVHSFKYIVEITCGRIPEYNDDEITDEDVRLLRRFKELKEMMERGEIPET